MEPRGSLPYSQQPTNEAKVYKIKFSPNSLILTQINWDPF
jgi:hypothetical protein